MNINRYNYEEFFLLYVDNELSASNKALVDAFVAQNPDLAVELSMLQDAVLSIDEEAIPFDKTALLKNETSAINSQNAEEQFLLYIDNELTAESRQQVETFVLQHPQQQQLFTQLKQTVLPIEAVACPNKEALLKEEKQPRVVYMRWASIAVAAIFIAAMATTGFIWLNNKTNIPQALAGNIATPKTNIANNKPNNYSATNNIDNGNTSKIAVATNNNKKIEKNIFLPVTKTIATPYNNGNTNTIISTEKNNIITMPIKDIEALVSIEKNKLIPVEKTTEYLDNSNTIVSAANNTNTAENIAIPTVYKELDTNTDDKALYVGGLELNKDKLRGLFRKASKILSGKAKANSTESNNAIATFALSNK